jgi:hypothetical protein
MKHGDTLRQPQIGLAIARHDDELRWATGQHHLIQHFDAVLL